MKNEEFEKRGFTRIYIPQHNCFGWETQIEIDDIDYSKFSNIEFLNKCLRISESNEDFEECKIIQDRISKLKSDESINKRNGKL